MITEREEITILPPEPLWPDDKLIVGTGEKPTLTAYLPDPALATGGAVVVCPGGGYVTLAEHEGEPVARWLAGLGLAAFVLHYRLSPYYRHPAMLEDAARAMRIVRSRAEQYQIDQERVGILGFSAGGHLATTLATHYDEGDPTAADPLEQFSSRPDLAILIYPVVSLQPPFGHDWSRQCLLGQRPDPAQVADLSNHLQVTPETPSMFMVHTWDDDVGCENSLLMAQALTAAGVPCELHLFQEGGHGYGLAQNHPILKIWPVLCQTWLDMQGFLSPTVLNSEK